VKRLLIVEDEAAIRESLVDFFTAQDFLVDEAPDLATARRLVGTDIAAILLDLRLPDGDGLDLLRDLRRDGNPAPVLILTARGEEQQRIRGLELGADDYVVKPFSVHELHARIAAVLRRTGAPAASFRIGEVEVDLDAHELCRDGEVHRLLQKEAELLRLLCRHPGRTFARDEILREVWGYLEMPTTRTVDTHVFNLRKKLEAKPDAPEHLLTVHGVGYKLVM